MTTVNPRLLALTTAVPAYALGQEEAAERSRLLFAGTKDFDVERMIPVFANAGIDRRYSCVPIDWYEQPHGWVERNTLYLENAVELLERAAREAMLVAGLEPEEIDAVVVVSTTGIATPSLDAVLLNRLGLRRDVRRLPIFGLGCAGGVLGLARAAQFASVLPKGRVLFLVVELCTLCFRKDDLSKSNLVAAALFADGAAAAVLSNDGDGPAITASGEHTWSDSLDVMGWDVADDGLKALFSRDIPTLVRREMRSAVTRFLEGAALNLSDIRHFACHPGGAKVVVALEEAFGIADGTLADERAVLRGYGNMSAATALFVLDRKLRSKPQGLTLMTALGPGFSAGFLLLDPAA